MNAEQFKDIFHVLHNTDEMDLVAAGVIVKGANGGSDWKRFNDDLTTFILKLRQENLEALFVLVRSKMTALSFDAYDQGRRDVLNAILALNPKVAQKLHILSGGTEDTFENHAGKLPFDVVFWTTEVAAQLGIQPKEEIA
jgi:hypothetical protein